MESFHVVGVGADDEKWSGSTGESGWTMYIGSPIHGERDDVDSSSDRTKGNKASLEHHHHDNEEDEEEEESDDSMASDASSRPISPHERGRAANRLRYAEKEEHHDKKHSTKKKKKKEKEKKNEEEILLHKADSAASHI